MPLNSKGKFFNSKQRAMAADKMAAPAPVMDSEVEPMGGGKMHSAESIEALRESFNTFLDEEAAEPGPHDPATIEALRESWNAFCDEEAREAA